MRNWHKTGAVSLVFLIITYQTAVFLHKTAMAAAASSPVQPQPQSQLQPQSQPQSQLQPQSQPEGQTYRRRCATGHRYESFRFNPNTVSPEDLERLGFSPKQAQSIINYREAGGKFRRKSDFAKSFVVADSVFKRLESFIDIPLVDINMADSAQFDELPGIGPYFAARMVEHREELGGYTCKEQLMDIYHFDREKFDALSDLISCSNAAGTFRLWSLPADSLRLHPYIRSYRTAKDIVLFRENTPEEQWSVEALLDAGIITRETAERLSRLELDHGTSSPEGR